MEKMQQLTKEQLEEKRYRLFKNLCNIDQLCELIIIYYYNSIADTRFRNPRIEDKAKKIKEFANSIKCKELKGAIKLKEDYADQMQNEHAVELWRVMDYFSFMPTDKIREFMDGVEKMEMEETL